MSRCEYIENNTNSNRIVEDSKVKRKREKRKTGGRYTEMTGKLK